MCTSHLLPTHLIYILIFSRVGNFLKNILKNAVNVNLYVHMFELHFVYEHFVESWQIHSWQIFCKFGYWRRIQNKMLRKRVVILFAITWPMVKGARLDIRYLNSENRAKFDCERQRKEKIMLICTMN